MMYILPYLCSLDYCNVNILFAEVKHIFCKWRDDERCNCSKYNDFEDQNRMEHEVMQPTTWFHATEKNITEYLRNTVGQLALSHLW